VARRVVKNKRVVKYLHPADKWIALRTKLREARLRDEGLVRSKMADFMNKALPAYRAAETRLNTTSSNKSLIHL
jgi:3-oxoacyl-[acyl-carrier-protein] synthase III